jgi:hypothetical protein
LKEISSKNYFTVTAQSGKTVLSIPKTTVPQKYITRVIIIILMVFSINPVLTISIIRIRFVPKMMAFGGVATGNINAMEAARVAGIINNS